MQQEENRRETTKSARYKGEQVSDSKKKVKNM